MVETSQPSIKAAIEVCDREIRFTEAELKAFEDFQSRLRNVNYEQLSIEQTGPGNVCDSSVQYRTERQSVNLLTKIRTAYRETVMDVPHFEDEYDETLEESLANEFDERLSMYVTDGQELTGILYGTLCEGVRKTITSRESYIQGIEKERRALRDVEDKLNECESRAVELHEAAKSTDSSEKRLQLLKRLNTIESECEELAQQRQSFLHDPLGVGFPGKSGRDFVEYLYANQGARYPALTDIVACIDSISHFRESIWRVDWGLCDDSHIRS